MSVDAGRYRSLEKLLELEALLEGRRYRPALLELAASFQVTPRTVARYLVVLKRTGRPIPPLRPRAASGKGHDLRCHSSQSSRVDR